MAGKNVSPPRSRSTTPAAPAGDRRRGVDPAVFALLGFLVIPPIAKHVAQKQLGELLGRKVTIERLRVNPFALSVMIGNFQIFEADQTTPFVGFRRLYVNAQLSSIYRRAPVIKEISLDGLRIQRGAPQGDARCLGRQRRSLQFLGHPGARGRA